MNLIAVLGVGVVAAAFSLLFKQYKPEYSMMISCIGVVLIFSVILIEMIPAFSTMRNLMAQVSFSSEYIKIIMKCLGICYLTEIGSQLCKESGQLAISSKIELAGKVMVLVLSLPMFEELLKTALNLINI